MIYLAYCRGNDAADDTPKRHGVVPEAHCPVTAATTAHLVVSLMRSSSEGGWQSSREACFVDD